MSDNDKLFMYVVYENPRDFPGQFVLREHYVDPSGVHAQSGYKLASTLEEIRAFVPPGMTNIGREPEDEPQIREVWI
jgi:hypothetical protein